QMQQVASDIFPGRSIGRAPKKNGKALDPPNVIGLCLDHEIAHRHVFDHAPAQRPDALIGHGILLSEPRSLTPRSSDRSIRPVTVWLLPCRRRKRPTARAVSFNKRYRKSRWPRQDREAANPRVRVDEQN